MADNIYGIMAEFDTPTEMVDAARMVRDAGYTKTDAFSPFPLHEIDEALGIKRSILPYLIFAGGITGLLTACVLTFGPSWFIYPLVVHGKPIDWRTVPAFFPIMFELTVLFSAFTSFFAMLIMNGLPRWYHPIFNWNRFARATNDGFFLVIEARDPRFTETEAEQLLTETGGQHITVVHED